MPKLLIAAKERLLRRVMVNGACWEWTGNLNRDGYGKFRYGAESLAQRASYMLLVGSIPEGLTIDHLCKNRKCINPSHLDVVTLRENILRGDSFSAVNKMKKHCPYGHAYSELNTYQIGKGRQCRICQRAAVKRYRDRNGQKLH